MLKALATTIVLTICVIAIICSLFYKSILGVFGVAVVSAVALAELRHANAVAEKLKQRHEQKKNRVSKRFAQKTGKRVATAALTASTIGTAGVVVVVAGFEAMQYCEEKKDLQEEENILLGSSLLFSSKQCFEEAQNDFKSIASEAIADISQSEPTKTWDKIKSSASSLINTAESSVNNVWGTLSRDIAK